MIVLRAQSLIPLHFQINGFSQPVLAFEQNLDGMIGGLDIQHVLNVRKGRSGEGHSFAGGAIFPNLVPPPGQL